ncbi:MAG: hypothetical protein ACYDHX_10365 [Methanothrix sp.]
MEPISAVIEEAEVRKISDIFNKKPPGLAFNETDALIVKARMEDGRQIGATFYFCMKPDGTFEEEPMGRDAVKLRRHRLASFLRYFNLTDDIAKYNLKERANELKGRIVQVVPYLDDLEIYVPVVISYV